MTLAAITAAQSAQRQKDAQQGLLDVFRLADATAESRALSLRRLGIERTEAFAGLEREGVLRSAGRDHYYLDEATVVTRRQRKSGGSQRGLLLLVMFALFVLLFGLVMLIAV